MLRLIDDWRVVALRVWSTYGPPLTAALNGLEFALPLIGEQLPLPSGWLRRRRSATATATRKA